MRKNVFALIKPGTASRLDLGLKLKNIKGDSKLVEAPGYGNGSITHKVALESVEHVDDQVIGWMKKAYNRAG